MQHIRTQQQPQREELNENMKVDRIKLLFHTILGLLFLYILSAVAQGMTEIPPKPFAEELT